MKLDRKWLLAAALLLCMTVAISSTLAYLTDADSKENIFVVGKVDITLEEPAWIEGQKPTLLPGVSIAKDPQIKNVGNTEAWVWMNIELPTNLVKYIDWNTNAWEMTSTPKADDANTTIVTMKHTDKLGANDTTHPAFTRVYLTPDLKAMPEGITNANGELNINIYAYGIQDANFGNVAVAMQAFDGKVLDENGTAYDVAVKDADELVAAMKNGKKAYLIADIVLPDNITVSVPQGVTSSLNLNGHTVSQSKECTNSHSMFANDGKLTITGSGKLSFTDTGIGDENVGWASYTIVNRGNLVVENGTIEHLGTQPYNGNNAIFNYSGTTTINGGTISAPYSRSLRIWHGSATINGGTFDGQVWVQAMENCSLTINGGSFKPATHGNDGSSVFVTNNEHDPDLSVTGGNFATKIGCTVPGKLMFCITGGTFTEDAKQKTDPRLFKDYEAPVAKVTVLDEDDTLYSIISGNAILAEGRKINATEGIGGTPNLYVMDTLYQFEPTMELADAQNSEYRYWHVDFVVSADKDVPAGSIGLAGYYDAWCNSEDGFNDDNWVMLTNEGMEIKAGEEVRLVYSMGNGSISVNYEEICRYGNDGIGFLCGAKNLGGAEGITITVELRMYGVEENGSSNNIETDESFTVCKESYTFK